jgi:sugar/nucleoside kinase (ribokinase family)
VKPVIVAGHVCLDLTPALDSPPSIDPGRLIGVGPLAISPGGCVSNTGLALVTLGVPTQLVADVGSDELGRVLVALLADSAADTAGIARLDGRDTSYSVVVDFPGRDRTFWHHVGANAAFDGSGVVDRIEKAARGAHGPARDAAPHVAPGGLEPILHLGYATHLPALYADGGAALIRLLEAARVAGAMISLDMAEIAAASEARSVDWEGLLARTLPAVDVMKASVDDLVAMMPGRAGFGPTQWADLLVELGAAAAIVTDGANGLYLRTAFEARIAGAARTLRRAPLDWSNRELWVPSLAARVLVTTGAGDVAAAGFVAGLAQDLGPAESALLSAAAAATRISGLPIGQAPELAAAFVPDGEQPGERRPGWPVGPDRVYHGPRDREAQNVTG